MILTRAVPQRRRPNLWPLLANELTAAAIIGMLATPIVWLIFECVDQPSRLQPVLDRTGVTGEVEVVR